MPNNPQSEEFLKGTVEKSVRKLLFYHARIEQLAVIFKGNAVDIRAGGRVLALLLDDGEISSEAAIKVVERLIRVDLEQFQRDLGNLANTLALMMKELAGEVKEVNQVPARTKIEELGSDLPRRFITAYRVAGVRTIEQLEEVVVKGVRIPRVSVEGMSHTLVALRKYREKYPLS